MRFSSLSSADKVKAGGLAGLIVIVLFFVVNTMLGVVSPPKTSSDGASGQSAGPTTGPDATAPTPAAPAAPAGPGSSQQGVVPPSVASGAKQVTGLGIAGLDMHDPFVPIRDVNRPLTGPPPARHVDTAPAISVQSSLPMPGGSGDPGFPAVGPVTPPPPPPAPQPEIRLIGFVHGDSAVATLQVDGRAMLCRPGDMLAAGYRLVGVSPEAVHVRHGHALLTLRTGEVVNSFGKAGSSAAGHP